MQKYYNIANETNLDLNEIINIAALHKPMSNLTEVLDRLDLFLLAFKDANAIRESSKAAVLQAHAESLSKVEFRLSPHYIDEKANIGYDAIMGSILEGFEDAKSELSDKNINIDIGIILISSRNYGPELSIKTAELARKWRKYVVGFDFAAQENLYPASSFLPTVNLIKDLGLPLTVHTGEGTTPENIEEVLDLYQPQRLGHATKLIENRKLMEYCRDHKICIEACPTSNVITNSVRSYEEHPSLTYFKFGIPVTINSDDPMLFGTGMNQEWLLCLERIGFTKEDLLKTNEYAEEYSFMNYNPN